MTLLTDPVVVGQGTRPTSHPGVFDPEAVDNESDAAERIDDPAEGERAMGKKARKGIAAKEPPVPTDNHAEIEDWMTRLVMPEMQPIVEWLDGSIRETIPGLQYAIKWKQAYYGLPDLGWIIELAALHRFRECLLPRRRGLRPSSTARNDGSEPLRQADDPGGGPGTGDARMDRTSRARAGLEMTSAAVER